jgi:hypothetical protein
LDIETKLKEEIVEVAETFSTEESEGFSLDFYQKVRTNDQIRRNFLSKLTY